MEGGRRHFRKRKEHGQRHSNMNMQTYFRKDGWMDFPRTSVLTVSGKNDGDGKKGGLEPDS